MPAPPKVLCVDPHEDVALSLELLLSASGFEVRTCRTAAAALAEARTFRPGACVLEVRLPGDDGYELADRLRALLGDAALLVALTVERGTDWRAGRFDAWVRKPGDPGRLLAALRAHAEGSGRG